MKNVLYYFSATGNTERAAGIVAKALREVGQETDVEAIRAGRSPERSPLDYDRVIVAFPTLGWTAPVHVLRFVGWLPRGNGRGSPRRRAAVLTADGGGCGPAPLIVAAILRSRGYDAALAGRASYAENWIQVAAVPKTDEEAASKMAVGDAMSLEFAGKLVGGTRERFDPGFAMRVFGTIGSFLFTLIGRRYLGKTFIADSSCNGCGLCAKTCPAHAIAMSKGVRVRPYWSINCEDCNRCINTCPKNAINTSIPRAVLLLGLIIAAAEFGNFAFVSFAWPGIAVLLPSWLQGAGFFLLKFAVFVAAHVIVLWPLDFWILRFLQRIPIVARFFGLSFTRKLLRYRAPGYKPAPLV